MKKLLLSVVALAAVAAYYVPQTTVAGEKTAEAAKAQTIVEIAAGNEDFSTLVTAVKAAGLVETLSGAGPFTVFAPTNEAFAKVDKEALASLLKPENKEALQNVLKYHVVSGTVKAADVVKVDSAKAVNGDKITVEVKDGHVILNGTAKVVKTDIIAGNGVIHVIDTVIMPPKQ